MSKKKQLRNITKETLKSIITLKGTEADMEQKTKVPFFANSWKNRQITSECSQATHGHSLDG